MGNMRGIITRCEPIFKVLQQGCACSLAGMWLKKHYPRRRGDATTRAMRKTSSHPTIKIRELASAADWRAIAPLVQQQNPDIPPTECAALLKSMRAGGYRCAGAFQGKALVGIMGFWIGFRFWCRKYIDIDNVIVDEAARSQGIGKALLAWVEEIARAEGCTMAVLDSYTTAHRAHRFYFREGYVVLGYHFTKKIQ